MAAKTGKRKAKKAPARKKAVARKPGALKLAAELNIKGVDDLKETLSTRLASGQPVRIDAGSVESVDTAALQLLLAFSRLHEMRSGELSWVKISDAFLESARLLDIDQHLGIGSATT